MCKQKSSLLSSGGSQKNSHYVISVPIIVKNLKVNRTLFGRKRTSENRRETLFKGIHEEMNKSVNKTKQEGLRTKTFFVFTIETVVFNKSYINLQFKTIR